ncbi:LAME_0G00188g1_1 [Lachancea meyersii CBS 8951]|uniref:LAME_0G00188g1_1 n=1 Tax=Lachancea meyersii CBS 8951 TaxID=1266667 RepID=A0A1G4K4L1_9SACH|nr:LAME_0G00188g1_1 [Lachancea meyersii CBS 8951]
MTAVPISFLLNSSEFIPSLEIGKTLSANEVRIVNEIGSLAESLSLNLRLLEPRSFPEFRIREGHFSHCSKIYLEEWFVSNSASPYLSSSEAHRICEKTGLTLKQVQNWMANRRRKCRRISIEPALLPLLD